ncbi:MAG: hypothetical protein II603_01140 [Muribaculaceae bacterium]|nr:hypothetical protein [Muribaculaceae bacterium]
MDFELDEMRQQMAKLKNKLDNQMIVNDRFIRRSIRNSVSTINKRYLVISAIALAMIPYGYWAFVKLNGLSIWLWLATCVMMLAVVGFCFFNGRDLRDHKLVEGNLQETMRKVALAKKRDNNWLWVGIPMALGWGAWAIWEMAQKAGKDADFLVPCCIVGLIIGALIGVRVHMRTQRHYRDILDQIEDAEDTEDTK